jgi:hypothetical protein
MNPAAKQHRIDVCRGVRPLGFAAALVLVVLLTMAPVALASGGPALRVAALSGSSLFAPSALAATPFRLDGSVEPGSRFQAPSPASASSRPISLKISETPGDEPNIYSTRALIRGELKGNQGQEFNWSFEYATSKGALEAHAGVLTNNVTGVLLSGTLVGELDAGLDDATGGGSFGTRRVIHHLKPATAYFGRFTAEQGTETAEVQYQFTTLPAAKPEVAKAYGLGLNEPFNFTTFHQDGAAGPTTAAFVAQLETNGSDTHYEFEYAPAEAGGARPSEASAAWKPFTSGAAGSITAVEDFAATEAHLTGLTPETTYFVRLKAVNAQGSLVETEFSVGGARGELTSSFTTPTAKPAVAVQEIRNVTAEAAHLSGVVEPRLAVTHWRFESAPEATGPWTAVAGAAGTISEAEAKATSVAVDGALTGLHPATTYYVRLVAENECAAGCGATTSAAASFKTSGPPAASTFAVHALHGEAVRVLGSVNPESTPTSEEQTLTVEGAPAGGTFTLSFGGDTTPPVAFDATGAAVGVALNALPSLAASHVSVSGPAGGPYTVFFGGAGLAERDQPALEANAAGLTPAGAIAVATTQQGGVAYIAQDHFEYEPTKNAGAPFSGASSTAVIADGSGNSPKFAGADLPGLTPGETYRYRISATNTSPGNPVLDGAEQTLTVSAPVPAAAQTCPNQPLRAGSSSNLPDCRVYEQLTPADKRGALELFSYDTLPTAGGVLLGEDGEHVMLAKNLVNYGSGPHSGQSPYFFSRDPSRGWQMTAAAIQPETGVNTLRPQLYSLNLTDFAFNSEFQTGGGHSPDAGLFQGPPGGPYVAVAKIPITQLENDLSTEAGPHDGLVAASEDFSKLVLQTEDHTLLGTSTGTKSGNDLYLYERADEQLSQINLAGDQKTIGVCGARIVRGVEGIGGYTSSRHAVSADGSHVFFEAVPSGQGCGEPAHLYMRVDGEQTVDLGAHRFLAADAEATKVLLETTAGREAHEVFLYETRTATLTPLFTDPNETSFIDFKVTPDLTQIYFTTDKKLTPDAPSTPQAGASKSADLYRFDVASKALTFELQVADGDSGTLPELRISPDGRYVYFSAKEVLGFDPSPGAKYFEEAEDGQLWRYDRLEKALECISCASPSDSEPALFSTFGASPGVFSGGVALAQNGTPGTTTISANGDYAFFSTPAALVRSDNDGEVLPEGINNTTGDARGHEHYSRVNSVSSDIYEWRRSGLDGCTAVQGCLALITNGQGGFLNLLLGTADEGRDVLIYTSSQLSPGDKDTAGDIYDVRAGGGFPPPPAPPVECEDTQCSTPASPPVDSTPSSMTFSGPGNIVQPGATQAAPKPKSQPPKKRKKKKKKHRRKTHRSAKHARKSSGGRRS